MNLFYDCVLIDEFQDFREYDYELIMALAKQLNDVVFAGDYHQHSVSAKNNSGKPFKNKSNDVSYESFVAELQKFGFEVDTTTLNKSRRCSAKVCEYVSEKLRISITSSGDHSGEIIWIDENPTPVLENDRVVKLVFQDAGKYSFPALNWSYSKGDTLDEVCVVLTENFDKLASKDFSVDGIAISTLNKLYVAMTRSKGNLYLISAKSFKKIKQNYLQL